MNDEFGDRMKLYEGAEAARRLMPLLPACARLDGKGFHNFTKGMERPYDARLSALMVDCCTYLVQETNACMGYTQSDEITLAWLSGDYYSQIFFDGRIQKMVSVLSSMCATYFNESFAHRFGGWPRPGLANFDCRVWNVPNADEGANVFLWREKDATKNSISMAARAYFSHKQVDNKNGSEMQEMLWQKGINWNDYPAFFKRGTFVSRRVQLRKFTATELDKLPERHEARRNPDLMIERTEYVQLDMPPFGKVINRPAVVFDGADPALLQE